MFMRTSVIIKYDLGYNSGNKLWTLLDDELFASYMEAGKEQEYELVKIEIALLMQSAVRASSIVENTNHRIRPYIDAKKRLSTEFCALLHLFLATKKYRRSVKGRAGKSPLELMTGQSHPTFLEMLGINHLKA